MRIRAMSAGSFPFVLLACLLVASAMPGWAAQTNAEPDQPKSKPAEISLGDVSGRPGESVLVPVYAAPGDGPKLRSVELNIVYPSATFKFDKVTKSSEDKWKDVDISVEDFTTTGEGRTESSTLVVLASLRPSTSSAPSSAGGIPQGVFGKLAFRIDPDADGDILNLRLTAQATAVGENSPLPDDAVNAEGSIVYVLAPGNFPGCFFFTH
jgi:hypothetical protein